MNRIMTAISVGAALAVALGWLSYPYIETARIWYSVTGIDVSHHQGHIDWPEVAQSGVKFAYMKATEGGDFVDSSFGQNWAEAKAAGIAVGAYHFYRQCKTGKEQADNFLSLLPREAMQLPPVIDVEHMGPCPEGTAVRDPVAEVGVFLDVVGAETGCRPILYATPEFEAAYLRGHFDAEKFWVRSIFLPPLFRQNSWILWQYHHMGRRQGIAGPVDLNAFRGDLGELSAWIKSANCFGPKS